MGIAQGASQYMFRNVFCLRSRLVIPAIFDWLSSIAFLQPPVHSYFAQLVRLFAYLLRDH
ncbi:hypothetical protein Csa_005979, partial [Cucumis sativus]